ncbi:Rha family transcriptional regulator [Clostridium sporogenes]|uniref:Rha family transcriptional regulator n=1 Tax=Clostridium sporogenes TaxID=1509 RepID=A0AAE4JU93_CLOSG|nr:Rha family transcriptional regulator [Clostridium sporogenes]MDS1004941.1 Rha family transcriptional regulator [Clostridium sporogenes]
MGCEVTTINNDNLTLDSREVAIMTDKKHSELLKDIRRYSKYLNEGNFHLVDFFIRSKYKDNKGEERPNYQITKKGCELIAHKMTGVKGTQFTATYINKFHEMEQEIKSNQLILAKREIEELKNTVNEFKRLTEEAKQQYKPSHKTKLDYNKMIKSLTNNDEDVQIVKDWVFGLLGISKWEDTCVEDSKKIIETITTISRLLTIKKFEQLRLF